MSNTKRHNKSLTYNKHYYGLGGIEVTPNMLKGSSGNGIIPQSNLDLPTFKVPTSISSKAPSKFSQFLKSDGFKQIANVGIGMAGTAIGGALSGGMSSGIGNTMGQIGGLVGQVNPIAGAAINVAGGLFNRAFGSKMNDANIATVENRINQLNNFQSDANSFDTLADTWGSTALGTNFNNSYIGKDGWFSNKAARKARELRKQQDAANAYVMSALQNNADNLTDEQFDTLEANYAALGGLLHQYGKGGPIFNPFTKTWTVNGKRMNSTTWSKPFGKTVYTDDGFAVNYDKKGREFERRKGTQTPSIRGKNRNEREQKYFDKDKELSDSVKVIAKRYNLNPSLLASRIARERVDSAIDAYNESGGKTLLSQEQEPEGPSWGLDDFSTNVKEGRVNLKEPWISFGDLEFENKKGRTTMSAKFNKAGDAVSATAAELKARRDRLKKKYPNLNNEQLDAAASASFRYGETGVTKIMNNGYEDYSPFIKLKAFGGDLNTNGADFSTGLTFINEGGTHESNPYEGVPMGIAPDGKPNLVEEGEVVYNNYVFSNRLTVPKAIKSKYKLRGKKDLTFADAVKQLSKNIEERPNDKVSKDTLDESLSNLAQIQELMRVEKETNYAANGGCLHKHDNGGINYYAAQSNYNLPNNGRSGKPLNDKYQTWDDFKDFNGNPLWVNNDYTEGYKSDGFRQFANNLYNTNGYNMYFNENTLPNYFKTNSNLTDFDTAWRLGHDKNYGDYHKAFANLYNMYLADKDKPNDPSTNPSVTPTSNANPTIPGSNNTPYQLNTNTGNNQEIKYSPEWLRFIPAAGLGIATITDALGLTNKPDYTAANSIEAAYRQGNYKPVRYSPIGNYLTYNPIDRERLVNRLNATSGATRRALANQSGGNSGKTIAGLLASDYNTLNQLGQAIISADEYNNKQRQAVEEFNRQTNIQNSQGALQADMANQQAYANNRQAYLQGISQAASLRQQAKEASDKAKSANLSGLLQSLGDIGYENKNMNMIRGLYASGAIAPMTDDIASAFNLIKNNGSKTKKSSNKRNKNR